ncbi:MAG: FG-GAP repeat domain-containing protein, partial [Vicinamibacterales bacterium]
MAADFDRDGFADIAVVDFLSDVLTVRYGTPTGDFDRTMTVPTGRGPTTLVAADFNNDGVIDLAVGALLSGEVRLLLGQGDGRFAAGQAWQMGRGVSSLVAHDVDGDGVIDLASANALSGVIAVLTNVAQASSTWVPATRVRAPTLLESMDLNGDGLPELVAVDADGRRAWALARDATATRWSASPIASASIGPVVDASLARPSAAGNIRLTSVIGDGQAQRGGSSAREPLVVEARDSQGVVSVGRTVALSRLVGEAEVVGAGLAAPAESEPSSTDQTGRAQWSLLLPSLPDATVLVATLAPDQLSSFRVAAHFRNDEIARLIDASVAGAPGAAGALGAYRALLLDAVRHLEQGDSRVAINDLIAAVDRLEDPSSPEGVNPSAANLSRRFLRQILLMGPSPQAADDEPITCDVPLTRTIAVVDEVDRFTFDGMAGERVHITMATESATSGSFGVWWRLLASDGSGVAGCNTFSASNRDCTLPASEAYAIEVVDNGFNGTGTYSVLLQRLTAGRRCGTAITCDVPASTTISSRVDTDLHEFPGVAGERVHVVVATESATSGSFGVWWRLLASDGSGVAGCNAFSASNRDCTLPATEAAYAVEVLDLGFDGTGTYSLLIQRLTAGQRCGTAITCDVPASTTISSRVDTDLHEFPGVAGERVHVVVATE